MFCACVCVCVCDPLVPLYTNAGTQLVGWSRALGSCVLRCRTPPGSCWGRGTGRASGPLLSASAAQRRCAACCQTAQREPEDCPRHRSDTNTHTHTLTWMHGQMHIYELTCIRVQDAHKCTWMCPFGFCVQWLRLIICFKMEILQLR